MADHSVPDYELEDVLNLETADQFRALFDETRLHIIDMLTERAATVSQLAEALDRPKGTVGHHVGVLEAAGLIQVVRTQRVRAIQAKYYGRTARIFDYSKATEHGIDINLALARAIEEMVAARDVFPDPDMPGLQGVRYARIPPERAREWAERLKELVMEFTGEPREGDVVYGLAVALYPTDRPHLK